MSTTWTEIKAVDAHVFDVLYFGNSTRTVTGVDPLEDGGVRIAYTDACTGAISHACFYSPTARVFRWDVKR